MSLARDKALWSLLRDLGRNTPEPGVETPNEKMLEGALIDSLTELKHRREMQKTLMEPVPVERMTLHEIEALGRRLGDAAKLVRDARETLGLIVAPVASPLQAVVREAAEGPPTRVRTPISADEAASMRAQREELAQRNRDEGLPDVIRKAEGLS